MIASTLLAIAAALSSLVAVNGAIVQRQATFTYQTPQPTASTGMPTSSSTAIAGTCSTSTTGGPPPPVTKTSSSVMPTGTQGGGGANCNGVQQWQAAFAYTAGDQAIYNGQLYTAKQWTYNNAPASHPDQWAAGGACALPINNQANCNGVAAWASNVAYTSGNRATYNGHLWSAVQWTQSNAPGDSSGTWKDLGACA